MLELIMPVITFLAKIIIGGAFVAIVVIPGGALLMDILSQ